MATFEEEMKDKWADNFDEADDWHCFKTGAYTALDSQLVRDMAEALKKASDALVDAECGQLHIGTASVVREKSAKAFNAYEAARKAGG